MKELVKIANKELQIKEFNGQRVLTFKDIDTFHERPEGTANKRFLDNQKHFEKNIDYFEFTGDDLKSLKQLPDFRIGLNASKFTLITESGYLMLVKSFQDDLAWKVQRELVNNYFRKSSPKLSKELQAIFVLDERTQKIESKVNNLESNVKDMKENSPLYNVECKELQLLVRKAGTKALGGYDTPAYKDNSLRGKVYADIQRQLKREFGVKRYEAIKRCQLNKAKEIIEGYKVPTILSDNVQVKNNQLHM